MHRVVRLRNGQPCLTRRRLIIEDTVCACGWVLRLQTNLVFSSYTDKNSTDKISFAFFLLRDHWQVAPSSTPFLVTSAARINRCAILLIPRDSLPQSINYFPDKFYEGKNQTWIQRATTNVQHTLFNKIHFLIKFFAEGGKTGRTCSQQLLCYVPITMQHWVHRPSPDCEALAKMAVDSFLFFREFINRASLSVLRDTRSSTEGRICFFLWNGRE